MFNFETQKLPNYRIYNDQKFQIKNSKIYEFQIKKFSKFKSNRKFIVYSSEIPTFANYKISKNPNFRTLWIPNYEMFMLRIPKNLKFYNSKVFNSEISKFSNKKISNCHNFQIKKLNILIKSGNQSIAIAVNTFYMLVYEE